MKIPKHIYDAIHTREGWDKLYLKNYTKTKAHRASYEMTVEQIQEHIPDYQPTVKQESYKVLFYKSQQVVDVPDDIIEDVINFDERFYVHLRKHKIQRVAYQKMMEGINKYFPLWRKYKNYQTFRKRNIVNR